jgi:hypothetical protein
MKIKGREDIESLLAHILIKPHLRHAAEFTFKTRELKKACLCGLYRQQLTLPTSSSHINGESIQQLREPAAEQQSL